MVYPKNHIQFIHIDTVQKVTLFRLSVLFEDPLYFNGTSKMEKIAIIHGIEILQFVPLKNEI